MRLFEWLSQHLIQVEITPANQDKGNFHTKLIKQAKQIKTEKARKRQLNSFTEREKVHVTMSWLLVVSDKKPLHFLITMDALKLFLFLSLFVCFVYF